MILIADCSCRHNQRLDIKIYKKHGGKVIMAEYYNKKSGTSGVSTAALITGIAGTVLGLNNANNGGVIGNILGNRQAPVAVPPAAISVDVNGNPVVAGCGYVTEKEMIYIQKLAKSENENTLLKSEKYTNEKITESLAPVYTILAEQNKEICDLKAGLVMESERRSCGDEKIVTYVDGNYIKAEKSINSRHVNYHGCKPVIEIKECCCESA